jgi:NADH-quinone oxidoreductase subunit L
MGGLKRYLPITYWTFLIGALAIAGVPFLSGFFSKDEILYETFRDGHTLLWLMAAITSLLTATYMFRLVFLTFHGNPGSGVRGPGSVPPDAHAPDPGSPIPDPGYGHLHDAPPAMAFVLVALALGSVLAGYIGIPHALGGHNALAAWLAPSFQPPGADAAELEAPAGAALELSLMGVSSAIAIGGILLASFFWLRRRELAAALAQRYSRLYTVLLNKYYVDELYDAAVVHPIQIGSERGLWRGVDVGVVDGAVNGTGAIVAGGSGLLRRLQTGSVRAYAGSMFIGVIVILGYYLWR